MAALGYARYGAQGGDWGAQITTRHRPRSIPSTRRPAPQHADRAAHRPSDALLTEDGAGRPARPWRASSGETAAYAQMQGTQPADARDRPRRLTGRAAGVDRERFRDWSDCDGDARAQLHPRPAAHQRDALLGDPVVHVVGAPLLGDHASGVLREALDTSTCRRGRAVPKEIIRFPRSWVEQRYHVDALGRHARGGHFAAMEEPELFVDDVRTFFRTVP